jgi:hypothetical protein
MKGAVDLNKLLAHFVKPEIISEVDVGILAKAFIFYGLGTVLLPTRSRTGQPHYLPLLGEEIKSYAWGSAVLAHIKADLDDIIKSDQKQKPKSSISCFSLALTVFALECFPILTRQLVPILTTEVPLSLGWIDVLVNHFKLSKKRKPYEELEEKFNNMLEDNINWRSYIRLQVSRDFEDQLNLLKYSVVPCIDFYNAYMIRPDICDRQLGLTQEEVKPIKIPEKLLVKPSVHKNIDLRSYVGGDTRDKKKKVYTYPQLHEMWANRFAHSVIAPPAPTDPPAPTNPPAPTGTVPPTESEVLKYLFLFFLNLKDRNFLRGSEDITVIFPQIQVWQY